MRNKHFIFIIFNCIVILVLAIKSPLYASTCTDNDNDSYAVEGGLCGTPDCDDQDNRVFPGALKICDGKDNNCDGKLDFTTDKDDDGDGVPLCGGDCNDNDPSRSPLNREGPSGDLTCNDGIDNDCDNRIDFIDPECLTSCQDNDGDGFGSPGNVSCLNGYITDCNDNDPLIYAGAADNNCDNIDNNCSGTPDDEYVPVLLNCGQGACSSTGFAVCQNGIETITCIEGTPQTEGPLGDLTCIDAIDNDCDGRTDSADTECINACIDNDGDGFGNPGSPDCPNGPVTDCNDIDPGINPGHIVYCDETNSDCNSYVTLRWRAP